MHAALFDASSNASLFKLLFLQAHPPIFTSVIICRLIHHRSIPLCEKTWLLSRLIRFLVSTPLSVDRFGT